MNNITDYIKIYKNALSVNFCKVLLHKANLNQDEWTKAKSMNGRDSYRSARFFKNIDRDYKTKKGKIFNFDSMLYTTVGNILEDYQKTFQGLSITGDEGYQLLKYNVGDYHVEHVDNCIHSKPRSLSVLFLCNEDFSGGELKFMGDHAINMGGGDAIIFPSNFMFPHKVTPITEGTRYTISTFCN